LLDWRWKYWNLWHTNCGTQVRDDCIPPGRYILNLAINLFGISHHCLLLNTFNFLLTYILEFIRAAQPYKTWRSGP
jgi:hypothetical protein